jgi:class 3 adenylate cyclase
MGRIVPNAATNAVRAKSGTIKAANAQRFEIDLGRSAINKSIMNSLRRVNGSTSCGHLTVKIFAKLFLLLLGLSAVPLAIVGGVVFWRSGALRTELLFENAKTGSRTANASQRALYGQARLSRLQFVQSKAAALEDFFEEGRRAVQLQSTLVRSYLADSSGEPAPPLRSSAEMARLLQDSSFIKSRAGKEPYAVYRLAPGIQEAAVRGRLERLARLGDYYAYAQAETPWVVSTYYADEDGFIVGYPGTHPSSEEFDPRLREWYVKAKSKGRLTWTELHFRKDGQAVITCAEPVFQGGKLIGVAAADFELKDFLQRLFDVGQLKASDAILANYLGGIRVAAHYRGDGTMSIESSPPETAPKVAQFMGGRFAPAFAAVLDGGSGALATDAGGRVVNGVDGVGGGDLYAYAPVTIHTFEGGKKWFYVVRTPMSGVLGPVFQIRHELRLFSDLLSRSIAGDLHAMGRQIAVIVSIVLLVALGLAYASAHSVTGPLLHIASVLQNIGRGDLDQRVGLERKDEVGQVGAAIDEMAKGLKEGLFVKSTFKRYVSASVVDQLLKDPARLKLGGERKELTVFFSDVSGFTSLSERLSPERLVELINEYLSEMTEAIFAHEGTLDKYEGDAIMAFWGAPVEQPDHALRACKAALDNMSSLRRLWTKWEAEGLPRLDFRIGLNTGPMVVGNMGSAIRMDYTVMGDAVNLGSRLEGANRAYGTRILISETTRRAAGQAIVARELDLLAVKGKTTAVRVFELVGLAGFVPPHQLAGYRAFEDGLEACRRRSWEKSLTAFREADHRLGGDIASRIFIERVQRFAAAPPPSDWDGRFVLTEK